MCCAGTEHLLGDLPSVSTAHLQQDTAGAIAASSECPATGQGTI